MAQSEILGTNTSSVDTPSLLGEQTAKSLFTNIVYVFRHHFLVTFTCSALPMIPLLFLMELVEVIAPEWVILAVLPYLLLSFVVGAALTIVMSDICLGNSPSVRRSYARIFGKKRWWYLISTALILTLGIYAGILLLILPGLWLMARGLLSSVVVALENRRNWDAIRRSIALSKGHAWRIVGLMLLSFAPLMLLTIALAVLKVTLIALKFPVTLVFLTGFVGGCAILAIGPAFAVTLVLLYYDLRVRRESYDAKALSEDLMR